MSRKGIKNNTPLIDRFNTKVKKTDRCWLWQASTNNKGYGIFHSPYGRLAHRYSWIAHGNPDPGKNFLLHDCDTPHCVRPSHLRIGTQAENMRDALIRSRKAGRPHGRSKLLPEEVRAIRSMLKPGVNDLEIIAQQFGITKGAVGHIKYGRTWSWLQ